MQESHELRPAPRRTPTAVLWLMAMVVVVGSAVLIGAQPRPASDPPTTSASSAYTVSAQVPLTQASTAPSLPETAPGALRVPRPSRP